MLHMSNTLIWLDDMRNPFTNNFLEKFSPVNAYTCYVVWLKSYDEFKNWIDKNGLPKAICFDHDLGDIEKTGYDCAKYLVEFCMNNDCDIPKFGIQSSNVPGSNNISGILSSYHKFYRETH